MLALVAHLIAALRSLLFRSRQDQAIVELALRQQLAIYAQKHRRPRLSPLDRAFWVVLSRRWSRWKTVLVVGSGCKVSATADWLAVGAV